MTILKLQKTLEREKLLVLPQQCQNKTKVRQAYLDTLAPEPCSTRSGQEASPLPHYSKFLSRFRSPPLHSTS